MSNILLVEPNYRSKFPPLGLMRLSTFHKARGDAVTFVRGNSPELRKLNWHRVYVSSLFTYELPRTVATAEYYAPSVSGPDCLIVGGIGSTLLPDYVRGNLECRLIVGPLDRPGMIDDEAEPIGDLTPDYEMLSTVGYKYRPEDSYFCRITLGCIRKCGFCAVPTLEPEFSRCASLESQLRGVIGRFGERQHLVLLDNNVLAMDDLQSTVQQIRSAGFGANAKRSGRQRTVDFNQGIDARLITSDVASLLSTICLSPVRLAFDHDSLEAPYRLAIQRLAQSGFREFTNYVMFNYDDTPRSLHHRLRVNAQISHEMGIKVTSFPMRYIPISDIHRRHVSSGWHWKYLRGIQCILLATHGVVGPNPVFFEAAFGANVEEFAEIASMPERYIINRAKFRDNETREWQQLYRRLSESERLEFLDLLQALHSAKSDRESIWVPERYRALIHHYYPAVDSEAAQNTSNLP